MSKIYNLILLSTLMVFCFSGCSDQSFDESSQIKKENISSVIATINNNYYNLPALHAKKVIFEVRSRMMTTLLNKIVSEKDAEATKLKAIWDTNKIKSLKIINPLTIDNKADNLSVSKMLDSVEKGLNSTLKMLNTFNGKKLITDISKVNAIYETKNGIIVERISEDVTVKEKLYFDNKYRLIKSVVYKNIRGSEKEIFEFSPKFKEIDNKYLLIEIRSNSKIRTLTTDIKYNYSHNKPQEFPNEIEYTFITDRIRYNELFDIRLTPARSVLE